MEPNQQVIEAVTELIDNQAQALLKQDRQNAENKEFQLLLSVLAALNNIHRHEYLKKVLVKYQKKVLVKHQDPEEKARDMFYLSQVIVATVKDHKEG